MGSGHDSRTSNYQVRRIRHEGGDLPVLIDVSTGMPPISVLLWGDDLAATSSPNTVLSYTRDVAVLLDWSHSQGIDLPARFMGLQGLTRAEIRALAQRLFRKKTNLDEQCSYSTYNRRLAAISSYCGFEMDRYLDRCGKNYDRYSAGSRRKERLLKGLRKMMLDEGDILATTKITAVASEHLIDLFNAILHPLSELNPFSSHSIRLRNYLIFNLALATWPRRSELVLLEINDLDLGPLPTVKFQKKPDRVLLRRRDGASLKTRAREVPISDALAQLIVVYMKTARPSIVSGHPPSQALFVSRHDGGRLAAGSINEILRKASSAVSKSYIGASAIHPHMLRTTGSTEFRKRYQQVGDSGLIPMKAHELQDILTYAGGWSPNSRMPQRYTRQAIVDRLNSLATRSRVTK